VTFPVHVAEGNTGKKPAGDAPQEEAPQEKGKEPLADAGAAPSGPSSPKPDHARGSLPDPEPLTTARQWEYDFVYDKGTIRVAAVKRIVLPRPTPTARRLGRFAVELWVGKELVDRVRFDFPLLAGDDAPPEGIRKPLREAPRLGPGARTEQRVLVPDSDRATSAILVDRLTGDALPLVFPPDPATAPAAN